jgi:SAM-dependent methyltransferase
MERQQVSDTWECASPYEQYVGRWSRSVAPPFLSWLHVPAGQRWLDLGCGTGALSAAILDQCSPASVVGVEPSEGFLQGAKQNLGARVTLLQGSAAAIPLDDGSVDVVASGLVLNFVPDPRAALAEMARVCTGGGIIAAYVWDYGGQMELMRYFWSAAAELDPAAASLDEGWRFPLCQPEALRELTVSAGLAQVDITAIDIPTPFADFDAYWRPFLGGQGPAPGYAMSLDEAARGRLRERLRERIPVAADGSIAMMARAWAVRGVVRRDQGMLPPPRWM